MKKYLLAASIIAAPVLAYAQCPVGYACGPQFQPYQPPAYAPTPGQFDAPGLPPVYMPPPPPVYAQPPIGGFTGGPIGGFWSGHP
jgi:hypothetical protein